MYKTDVITFTHNDCEAINIVFNADNESVIMLANKDAFAFHRILELKIVSIDYKEIKSQVIKEHVDFYSKILFDLLKQNRTVEYINDFIYKEIFINCH